MNKKISLGAALAMILIIAAATFSITMVYARQSFNTTMLNIKEREATYSKLSEIDKLVRQKYFGTLDNNRLMDSISRGYLSPDGIGDPYARYYTVEEYMKLGQTGATKAVGIGMVTELDESGYIRVVEVYPESPALAAGIAAGDLIVRINDTDVSKANAEALNASIVGEPGTKIDLVTRRDKSDTQRSATRRDVEKPSVYAGLLEDKVGYVKITEFNLNTADHFNRSVDKLISDGALSLVFDVRGNQRGTVEHVVRILDKLLPQGPIVSATYKDGTTKVLSTSDPAYINIPITVIINEKTASGAELFAQALKDYELCKVVGVTSIGKATIQEVLQLTDGSAISITTAKFNPPKYPQSPNFDGVGVKPDFEVKLSKDQSDALQVMDLTTLDGVKLAREADPQLKKAFELAVTNIKATASETSSASSAASSEGSSSAASSDAEPQKDGVSSGSSSENSSSGDNSSSSSSSEDSSSEGSSEDENADSESSSEEASGDDESDSLSENESSQ